MKIAKISSIAIAFALSSLAFSGCLKDNSVEPTIIVEPPQIQLIGSDTITAGSYLELTIGESAESTYANIKSLKDSKGITYLNVVSNIFNDVTKLDGRLPLYQSLYFDETKGTGSGVQLSFEDGKVKSIYLNSGNQLNQWPGILPASSAIVTGDNMETLYKKLVKISSIDPYKNKFERMLLLTKDISKNYDANMTLSPQWYFAYSVEANKMDEVQFNFKDGVLNSIIVNHYLSHG